MPRLLLQPLVENAVFHRIELKEGPGLVMVRAVRSEGKLELTVRDDGTGMGIDALTELRREIRENDHANRYLALKNVYRRVKLLFGETVHVAETAELVHALEACGGTVRLKIYPDAEHDS